MLKSKILGILLIFFVSLSVFGCGLSTIPSEPLKELHFNTFSAEKSHQVLLSPASSKYLTVLRKEYSLDDLVSEAADEREKMLAITHWVHSLWEHDGNNAPDQSDPLSILRDVEEGASYRCVEYAIVIAGCLNALDIPTRVVSLRTEDVETRASGAGHVVCEAYLKESEKWVMIDGQWDVIPYLEGTPLNAVELQNALRTHPDKVELATLSSNHKERYKNWISEYLFYFQVRLDQRYTNDKTTDQSLMLVPIGAPVPTVFQKIHPIENTIATSHVDSFYQPPLVVENP